MCHKLSPNETLFLESTNKLQKDELCRTPFLQFQLWDFPGQMDFFDPSVEHESILMEAHSILFVIDAQVCSWAHLCFHFFAVIATR